MSAAKSDDLDSIPGPHMVEGKKTYSISCRLAALCLQWHAATPYKSITKCQKVIILGCEVECLFNMCEITVGMYKYMYILLTHTHTFWISHKQTAIITGEEVKKGFLYCREEAGGSASQSLPATVEIIWRLLRK